MISSEIAQILSKYTEEEEKIENLLAEKSATKNFLDQNPLGEPNKKFLTELEAKKRNADLLKQLETIKGNLRSKAIYSPAEMQWEEICRKYQENPSLPITTWRCNLPVFV